MDTKMTVSLVLIGLGAVAAGGLGLRLRAGDRISARLALVVGAGVGVMAIAIGSQAVQDSPESYETVFVTASVFGSRSPYVMSRRCISVAPAATATSA